MQHICNKQQSLLDALAELAPDSSKNTLRSWIKEGRILIDGRVNKNSSRNVTPGQKIAVAAKKSRRTPVTVLYEDKHIVVVEKSSGILSVAANYEKAPSVHSFIKERCRPGKVYVVHRLDQDTSGVICFALTPEAFSGLKDIFEKHTLERNYIAIVEGVPAPLQGTWTNYLYEDANYYVHCSDDPKRGVTATSHYAVKKSEGAYSWLEVTLETGRKNQIRVQCQAAGHPIVGDSKYGSAINPIRRLALHAHKLAFRHPVTGKAMTFEATVPDPFYKLIKRRD